MTCRDLTRAERCAISTAAARADTDLDQIFHPHFAARSEPLAAETGGPPESYVSRPAGPQAPQPVPSTPRAGAPPLLHATDREPDRLRDGLI